MYRCPTQLRVSDTEHAFDLKCCLVLHMDPKINNTSKHLLEKVMKL